MKKVLSDADVTKLRRTMADVDKLRGQIRTLHDRSKSSKRAGAHYVVKTPSGGIPASIGGEPGSADCNIHIRDGDPKELRDTTRAETVYNFGPAIPGDTILIAHRDAWGDLWAGEPSSGGVCEELDLQPGSYRGIAGATTAPGETGPVIVTGCEDEVTIDAVNHSGCTFYLGDLITVNVDPCCVAHFTGCSCCGAEDTPPACCDRSIVICIAGERQILAVNGGTYTWDVSECCDCEGATLEITLTCEEDTITAAWEYTCGESTAGDTIDLSALCSDDDVEVLGELDDICDGNLNDRWANFVEDCEPCGPEPCEGDCIRLFVEYLCIEQDCDNPEYTSPFDYELTPSQTVICPGDTVTVTCKYTITEEGYNQPIFADYAGLLTLDSFSPALGDGGFVTTPMVPQSVYWGDAAGDTFSVTFTIDPAAMLRLFCEQAQGTSDGILLSFGSVNDRNRAIVLKMDCCEE